MYLPLTCANGGGGGGGGRRGERREESGNVALRHLEARLTLSVIVVIREFCSGEEEVEQWPLFCLLVST